MIDLVFDFNEVEQILNNFHDFQAGIWPNGITPEQLGIRKNYAMPHAPHEAACLVAGEIGIRVKRCGNDGYLVEERYGMNWGAALKYPKEIAQERYITLREIENRINKVIWYVADNNWYGDKPETYEHYKARKAYRKKANFVRVGQEVLTNCA